MTWFETRATDFSHRTFASSGSKSGTGFEFNYTTLFSHRKLGPLNHNSRSESCLAAVPRKVMSARLFMLVT